MKTLITTVAIGALLTASAVFADDQTTAPQAAEKSTTELVAFQDLESTAVTAG